MASRLALAIALSVTVLAGTASAQTLSDDQIREHIIGKRVYLATPFGGEFPLYYKTSGSVSGDGTKLGLGKYFAPKETGRWWLEGNKLCQQWPSWYKGRQFCFSIEKTGPNQIEWTRDDGRSGIARIGA